MPFTYISIPIGIEIGAFALFLIGNPLANVELAVVVIETAETMLHVVAPLTFITVTIGKLISAFAMTFLVNNLALVLIVVGVLDMLRHLIGSLFLIRPPPKREYVHPHSKS